MFLIETTSQIQICSHTYILKFKCMLIHRLFLFTCHKFTCYSLEQFPKWRMTSLRTDNQPVTSCYPSGINLSHLCEPFASVIWCFSFPLTYLALFPLPWLPITPENLTPLFPPATMSLLFSFRFVTQNALPLFPSCLILTPFRKSAVPMVTLQYHRFQGKIRSEGSQHLQREELEVPKERWKFQVKGQQHPRASEAESFPQTLPWSGGHRRQRKHWVDRKKSVKEAWHFPTGISKVTQHCRSQGKVIYLVPTHSLTFICSRL